MKDNELNELSDEEVLEEAKTCLLEISEFKNQLLEKLFVSTTLH